MSETQSYKTVTFSIDEYADLLVILDRRVEDTAAKAADPVSSQLGTAANWAKRALKAQALREKLEAAR